MRRRSFLGSLAVVAGCRGPTRAEGVEVVVPSDPLSLDPRFSVDVHGMRLARLVHLTLTRPDPTTLAPTGALAETAVWEKDAVLVTLPADARFHDGTPITARDVLASFAALSDANLGSPSRRVLSQLHPPEAPDGAGGRRVRFRSRTPRATLLGDLDFPILKADEAARPRDAALTGSGSHRLASRAPGLVVLEPAGARPGRSTLHVRTVRDEAARAMRILGGRADVVANALGPTLALSLPARSDAPTGLLARTYPSASTTMLLLQNERPPLDRPEVRRAIAEAIDRAGLVAQKLGGAGTVARGLLPPALSVEAPPARAWAPERARAALAGHAGPLVLVTGVDRIRVGIARLIAQAVGDAGIPVEVRTFELATLLARLGAGDFHLAPLIASELTDPDNLRWYLHSQALPPAGANRARVRDADLDRWLDEGLAETDPAARRAIYARVEARVHERAYVLPLFHEHHVALTSRRGQAFHPTVDGRWSTLADV